MLKWNSGSQEGQTALAAEQSLELLNFYSHITYADTLCTVIVTMTGTFIFDFDNKPMFCIIMMMWLFSLRCNDWKCCSKTLVSIALFYVHLCPVLTPARFPPVRLTWSGLSRPVSPVVYSCFSQMIIFYLDLLSRHYLKNSMLSFFPDSVPQYFFKSSVLPVTF